MEWQRTSPLSVLLESEETESDDETESDGEHEDTESDEDVSLYLSIIKLRNSTLLGV